MRILQFKITRMRKQIAQDDIVLATPRIVRQLRYTEHLLQLIEETSDFDPRMTEYYNRLFRHMNKYVRGWWD